jgi:hypothetical protein
LKGDIVEALQVLKSLIKGKDMFQASPVASIDEYNDTEGSWDCFLDDNTENYEPHVIAA